MALSTTRPIVVSYSFSNLQNQTTQPCFRFCFKVSGNRNRCCLLGNDGRIQLLISKKMRRDFVVRSSVQPGAPLPSEPPSNSWKSWIIGAMITFILPFLKNKWGPLFILTEKVEAVVETADHVTEVIEEVATVIEKVADDIADELPEGGKLRKAIEFVEDAANKVVEDANFVEEIIDKVQEIEEEVDSFMDNDQANRIPDHEEANDQK